MSNPNSPSSQAPGDFLYRVGDLERATFGDAWCGPTQFEYGTQTLVASYKRDQEEGYDVDVLCTATPARAYTLVAKPTDVSGGFIMTTGTGMAELVASMAKAISSGMLTVTWSGVPK